MKEGARMSRKSNYLLIGFVVLVLAATAAWRISGASLSGAFRSLLLNRVAGSVNGSLSVGDVDFSLSGSLVAKDVELRDPAGHLVASVQLLSIDLDLTDLLGRRLDIERIRKVSFDGLILDLVRDKDSRWNATETLRKTPAGSPTLSPAIFRGQAVARNATIAIATTGSRYDFKKVDAMLDFAAYPVIAMDLKSKDGSAGLAAKGTWNFYEGGNVSVNADGVDPAYFSPNIPLKGLVTSTFVLAGTTDKPTATGSFRIPSGTLGGTSFSEAVGDFSLAGGTLSLVGTRMNAVGGSIATNGSLALDTLRYSNTLSGQNIDISQLTEKDIHGRLQFMADVQGQGPWEGARADGSFSMGTGSVSGISFDSLTGNFSKRGSYTRYYNLKATIAGQTVRLGDAENLNELKSLFKAPGLPGIPTPHVPSVPFTPNLPKAPTFPRLF
jgi:hypothetical protein